jgi:hypothetical protein
MYEYIVITKLYFKTKYLAVIACGNCSYYRSVNFTGGVGIATGYGLDGGAVGV